MSPRKRTSSYYLIGIVIVFALVLIFPKLGAFVSTPVSTTNVPSTSVPTLGVTTVPGKSPFIPYFTSPVIPFDKVISGGIENNLITLINQAQVSIDGAMFEFNLENVAKALIAAEKRGVKVRIVYDDDHTAGDPQIDELAAAGIPTVPDKRSAYMHNKFFVIDGKTVWTGSFNISINAAYKNNENAVVVVSPELAANYTTEFEEMFAGKFGPDSPKNTPYPRVNVDGIWVETYFAPEDGVMAHVISTVSGAQKSVQFLAFSFTDGDLAKAMLARLKDNVTITGVFETRGADTDASECAFLLKSGADIYLDGNPNTLHDKVIIIDGKTVITGSFNYSANADNSNDENLLIIQDPVLAQKYQEEFAKILAIAIKPSGSTCTK